MRIFNETKTIELTREQCDLSLGYFEEDMIVIGERDSLHEIINNQDGTTAETIYSSLDIQERVFVYKLFTQKELCQNEKIDLELWFDRTYTYKEQKYRRLVTLGLVDDDGISAEQKLLELYNEAEIKRKRIQELEQLIENIL